MLTTKTIREIALNVTEVFFVKVGEVSRGEINHPRNYTKDSLKHFL